MLSSAAALSLQRFRHGARRPPLLLRRECCVFWLAARATELAAVKDTSSRQAAANSRPRARIDTHGSTTSPSYFRRYGASLCASLRPRMAPTTRSLLVALVVLHAADAQRWT